MIVMIVISYLGGTGGCETRKAGQQQEHSNRSGDGS